MLSVLESDSATRSVPAITTKVEFWRLDVSPVITMTRSGSVELMAPTIP